MSQKKKKTYIFIPGDPVSREDLLRRIDEERLSYLKFEMEKIRTSDMNNDQKRIARSFLEWRIQALQKSLLERS